MAEKRVAGDEMTPSIERHRMRAGRDREGVDAVRRDDPDGHDEEDDEPGNRDAEQSRRRQIEPEAPTANTARRRHPGLSLD